MPVKQCRSPIQIQKKSVSLDAYGQQVNVWVTIADTMANIRPASKSLERMQGNQMTGTLTHTILTHYQTIFGNPIEMAGLRILFNSRVIGIVSARILEEKNLWVVFDCIEGTLDGQ